MDPVVIRAAAAPARRAPALRLVKTQSLDRAQWLAVRERGIGSSDAAAAVGLCPYKSPLQLWMEKTGRGGSLPSIDPLDDSSPLYWGTLLEPIVAAHYTRRTGFRVRRINAVLQHPIHPWMLANIDREVLGAPDVQILECKTAGLYGARAWDDGVPEWVQLQVQHQLAVTGKQAADIAVLIAGQELRIYRLERDESLIANLMALEQVFWEHVERDVPPPVDGSDSCDVALRALWPRDDGQVIDWRDDIRMGALFADLITVRQSLRDHTHQEALIKQAIQQRMGEASRAVFETGEVTWRRSQDSQVIDVDRLRREAPEAAKAFTATRPGTRRFNVVAHGE